jgi:Na+/proline symporter
MFNVALGFLAFFFGAFGTICLLKSFFSVSEKHSKKKVIATGWLGLVLLLGMGLILIYFYSTQPVSQRIIKDYQEKRKESLPDISYHGTKI